MLKPKIAKELYKVISSSPNLIQIEICDMDEFKRIEKQELVVGSYLKISDDKDYTILALVNSYKIKDFIIEGEEEETSKPKFILDSQPIGCFDKNVFIRGGSYISIPPTKVEIADRSDLETVYKTDSKSVYSFSHLVQDENIAVNLDGNKFFSKHIAVVGSTGSGKSCTVAKILHEATKKNEYQKNKGVLNNSHIVIFDIHGEYTTSFSKNSTTIKASNMVLPYWLMNSEELQELFIESRDNNAPNQISQFRNAVIKNKEKYNPGTKSTYDTPQYFSIEEVINYIKNLNEEVIGKNEGENLPKLKDDSLIKVREDAYFDKVLQFTDTSTAQGRKANNGPHHGDFEKLIHRFESKLNDNRLKFLLKPKKDDGKEYTSKDLEFILRKFIGYVDKENSNITIIDLSGVPYEILNIIVSLITRLLFDFGFYFKRKKEKGAEIPLLLVYEEAHKYVPKNEDMRSSVKNSIERVAKEGRKYGISLMIVSQRPSEISETVFSQCNNFVAMRLTNPSDQQYIQRLLPDNMEYLTGILPNLRQQEAIIVGDAISIPSVAKIDELSEKPDSKDIQYYEEWLKDWVGFDFSKLIEGA